MSEIEYVVTEADLQVIIDRVLSRYPWMAEYSVRCHVSCARRDIADEHGDEAGNAWEEYDTALWMLTGGRAGIEARS